MKTTIAGIILTAATFSGAALADYKELRLDVVPVSGGAWVSVEKGGMPQSGLDIQVDGARQETYTTTESGRVYIQSAAESGSTLTFKVTDESGNTVTTKRFISSNS